MYCLPRIWFITFNLLFCFGLLCPVHASCGVVGDDCLEVISGVVTPSALMPSKSPLWGKNWSTNDSVIHFGDFLWGGSGHNIKVADSTGSKSCHVNRFASAPGQKHKMPPLLACTVTIIVN